MKWSIACVLFASAVTTASELTVSAWIVCESLASAFSRLSVSVSAGTARRNAEPRSSERAATAAPSSLMMIVKRWR